MNSAVPGESGHIGVHRHFLNFHSSEIFTMVARTTTKTAAPKSNADLLMRIAELEGDNAALMRKSKPAKTATAPITPIEPVTANVTGDEADAATWLQRMRQSADGFLASVQAPSWMRRTVSLAMSITCSAVVAYGCLSLVELLLAAVVTYTTSGFVSFLIAFVGLVFSMIAAMTAASKVYAFAMEFEFSNVKSRIANFFAPKPAAPVAA